MKNLILNNLFSLPRLLTVILRPANRPGRQALYDNASHTEPVEVRRTANLLPVRLFSLSLPLLLPLLLASCSLSLFPGYRPCSTAPAAAPKSWFASDSGHYLFNTSIDIYKKHFSGLMVVKPLPANHYRVVFLTEVGIKIFDMEFSADSAAKVHYIMEAMNRKALVNTLSRDISLVLMGAKTGIAPECLRQRKSDSWVYLYRDQNRKNYYFVESSSVNPYLARQTGCITSKVMARLYGSTESGLDSVLIRHENIRLSLNLYRIKE